MDDHNLTRDDGLSGTDYLWYFMPKTLFATKHTFKTDGTFYDLPEFSEELDKSFYGRLKCYSDTVFTKSSGEAFAKQVIVNRYKNCTFVYVVCPKNVSYSATDYVIPLLESKEYFPSIFSKTTLSSS